MRKRTLEFFILEEIRGIHASIIVSDYSTVHFTRAGKSLDEDK